MNDNTNLPFSGTDINPRIAGLSPEKQALLLKRISLGGKDARASPVLRAKSGERSLERSFEPAPIIALPRTGDLPLSFAQQRLWFLDRLLPEKAAY